jgi:predicted SprT family Zn-dependent metalloprotease
MAKANKSDVKTRIKELKAYALKQWDIKVTFNVDYKLDSVRTLGTYHPGTKTMSLNANLLKEFGTLYIEDVVVHEFAHAVIAKLFPTKMNGWKKVQAHGKEFKAVCSHFGIDGKATTSLFNDSKTMKKSTITRFSYTCDCGHDHQLSKIKHNKIRRGANYLCSMCKSRLTKV